MQAVTSVPTPVNEPVTSYERGSRARDALVAELARQSAMELELTATIGGDQRLGGGEEIEVVQPHAHARRLGILRSSTEQDARVAIDAAACAAREWREASFDDRAAVFLRAAALLTGPWRDRMNAATMLGQSKTAIQAEVDAACELADFWRFNVAFARDLLTQQPVAHDRGVWNRVDHRPLEGFVYAITPFNFTAIAANLPTAPALMGNTVLWKPSPTQQLSAHYTMRLLEQAGLPPGVINMLPGDGIAVSRVALADPGLAAIHFTGSSATFQHLWSTVGAGLARYRSYPRLVGETGGKDFVVAHASADVDSLRVGLVRGAFEYQGQKCSAASRAYIARSVWDRLKDDLVAEIDALGVGPVDDLSNFMGAVIDRRAFDRQLAAITRARASEHLTVLAGGQCDDSEGFFVRPTLIESTDPSDAIFHTEFFGPILAVHVYEDSDYETVLDHIDASSSYALTGAVFANDRYAVASASHRLRFAAGNFYINDKPTGAVVGQQPFGGARSSGTNDKAGSPANLARWVSPRAVKENLAPPIDVAYPHMA